MTPTPATQPWKDYQHVATHGIVARKLSYRNLWTARTIATIRNTRSWEASCMRGMFERRSYVAVAREGR